MKETKFLELLKQIQVTQKVIKNMRLKLNS